MKKATKNTAKKGAENKRFLQAGMAALTAAFVFGLSAVPAMAGEEGTQVISEQDKKMQEQWEAVIEKVMDGSEWWSIDGKTNYADITKSEDLIEYQERYRLALEDRKTSELTFETISEEDAERYKKVSFYNIIDESSMQDCGRIEIGKMPVDARNYVPCNFGFTCRENLQADVKDWKECFHSGLYPVMCGIRVGDGYQEVMEKLGITEEMENWAQEAADSMPMKNPENECSYSVLFGESFMTMYKVDGPIYDDKNQNAGEQPEDDKNQKIGTGKVMFWFKSIDGSENKEQYLDAYQMEDDDTIKLALKEQ